MRLERRTDSTTRCALCHDELVLLASVWQCAACRTVLHEECRAAVRRCPTLGCSGRVPVRRTWWPWRVGAVAALVLLVVGRAAVREVEESAWPVTTLPVEPAHHHHARNETSTPSVSRFDELVTRGCERYRTGDLDASIALLTSAIEIDDASPRAQYAYTNRSLAEAVLGQHARALADAEKAIEVDPAHGEGFVYRGYARSLMGDDKRAIVDYARALETLDGKSELAVWCRDARASLEVAAHNRRRPP